MAKLKPNGPYAWGYALNLIPCEIVVRRGRRASTCGQIKIYIHFCVQFCRSVVSDSLWPHGLRPGFPVHHQLPELAQTRVHKVITSNHLILCRPLLLLLSIFPSIRVFSNESVLPIRCQSIGVSASASVLPMNIQDWFPLGLTGFFSLQFKGLSRVFSNTTVQKHQLFGAQLSLWSNSLIHTWLS